MPRRLTSVIYDSLSQRLERMADGISKHISESDFPARLDAAKRRELRSQLEDLRSKYENLMTEAERAYDAYFAHSSFCAAELAKDDDMLRGFYGKSNPVLSDYGTKVKQKPIGRKKTPPEQPS